MGHAKDNNLTKDMTIDFGELQVKQFSLSLGSLLCHVEGVATPLGHPKERERGRGAWW